MNPQEQKLKKKVQVIVAMCLSLFFILATVAVFQFAIRINQGNQEAALKRQSEVLRQQIENAENRTEYYCSLEFQEDYAMRYLNNGNPDDKVFG